MKKSKLLSLLLCASALALSGCGGNGGSSSNASGLSTSGTSAPTTTPTSCRQAQMLTAQCTLPYHEQVRRNEAQIPHH